MFERFTERARRVIILAQEEAKRLGHMSVGDAHILMGVVSEGEGVASKVLESLNINAAQVRAEIEAGISLGGHGPRLQEAVKNGHASVGAGHLLIGLIGDDQGLATRALVSLGVDLVSLRQTTETLVQEHGGTG